MEQLEKIVLKSIETLRKRRLFEKVILSRSHRKKLGVDISEIGEAELAGYLSSLTNCAYLHGVGAAKENWFRINGLVRPIVNAGVIELAKVLSYIPGFDKNHLYRAIGVKIGKNTTIAPRVQFDYFHPELIKIGDNCLVGDGAKIWTHNYGLDYFMVGSVKIGDNVLISSESVIGPGTTIGSNVQVNFGTFLYRQNIPSNSVVQGRSRSKYTKANLN